MAEVIIRAEARADMLDIYSHGLSQFGRASAAQYMAGIDQALARLADHPLIGPVYPGLRQPVRYLGYRSHHIYYEYDGGTVWVIRILHHAMDAARRL